MPVIVVTDNPEECFSLPGVETVAARTYLTESRFVLQRFTKVFNLCRSHRYQSIGYYVSLLAEARGHKPIPTITTIQDMKTQSIIRLASEELEEIMERHLAGVGEDKLSLNAYFGRTPDKRFEPLAASLYKYFPTPLLKADFTRAAKWQLQNVSGLDLKHIPKSEVGFASEAVSEYLAGHRFSVPKRAQTRYDLAILHNPGEELPPSNPKALKKFAKAADDLGLGVEFITKEDSRRLSEFDGLFIRETTDVNHHTYRLASRAVAEGLVVVDDPVSILRCSNKVYLAENISRHKISTPKTLVLHNRNLDEAPREFTYPFVLKQPDSSFSQGVVKVEDEASYQREAKRLLRKSEMIIAQEYLPTAFDWRIGVLDKKPLFACKYFMARKHWQIIHHEENGKEVDGRVQAVPLEEAPKSVVRVAVKAANLIGDGLYGVDLKQIGRTVHVIEINDNPNIDSGFEDGVLKETLYLRVMDFFLRRIDQRKRGNRTCS